MAATSQQKAKYEDYNGFVKKFEPKKTTDDCMTPPAVYDAVAAWVEKEFSVSRADFVRPFYPGDDYERYSYPDGCVVVDNPPFSIISAIVRNYTEKRQPFFLFAPHLSLFSASRCCCGIVVDATITYENGAKVKTGFVTNLDPVNAIRLEPGLKRTIAAAQKSDNPNHAKYDLPRQVVTAARLGRAFRFMSNPLRIPKEQCFFVRDLDEMRRMRKNLFGGGYIIPDWAAQKIGVREAEGDAIPIRFSDVEKAILDRLNKKAGV